MKLLIFALMASLFSPSVFAMQKIVATGMYIPVNRKIKDKPTYQIANYTVWIASEKHVNITFEMPEDLLGNKKRVVFSLVETSKGTNGPVHRLEGHNGTLTCIGKWVEARCSVAFKNLEFDYNQLQELSRKDQRNLVLLARYFSEEPLGLVIISKL